MILEKPFFVAAIQMCATSDKEYNFSRCSKMIEEASLNGAKLICLPGNILSLQDNVSIFLFEFVCL
jgi:predicted amidohydrolase